MNQLPNRGSTRRLGKVIPSGVCLFAMKFLSHNATIDIQILRVCDMESGWLLRTTAGDSDIERR